MQFKMNEVQLPEKISFNYEELKSGLLEKASRYEAMVYGEDEIKDAKADRSALNKLKKALNDERIRQEKEYMKPFNEFKSQVNEIIEIIDKPIAVIDGQIKEYEAEKKRVKEDAIYEYWESLDNHDWLKIEQIWDDRWLNASVSMKKVQEEINDRLTTIQNEIGTLEQLPEFSFEAVEVYKQTLNINKAVSEGQRLADIQKRKAEMAKAAEAMGRLAKEASAAIVEGTLHQQPDSQWLRFEAFLNVDQAMKLKGFFETNNISFKAI